MTQHSSHTIIQAHAEATSLSTDSKKKEGLSKPVYLQGPSHALDHHLGVKSFVDVKVYIKPLRRVGVFVWKKKHEYSNMSTEVLSKSYNRILSYMHILKKVVGLLQQASFDSWLSYPTTDTTCKAFVAHESTITITILRRGSSLAILREGHPRYSHLS